MEEIHERPRAMATRKSNSKEVNEFSTATSRQAAAFSFGLGQRLSLGGLPPTHPHFWKDPIRFCYPAESKWYSFMHVFQAFRTSFWAHFTYGFLLRCKTETHISASASDIQTDARKMLIMKTKLCGHENAIRVSQNCTALFCWWQTSRLFGNGKIHSCVCGLKNTSTDIVEHFKVLMFYKKKLFLGGENGSGKILEQLTQRSRQLSGFIGSRDLEVYTDRHTDWQSFSRLYELYSVFTSNGY